MHNINKQQPVSRLHYATREICACKRTNLYSQFPDNIDQLMHVTLRNLLVIGQETVRNNRTKEMVNMRSKEKCLKAICQCVENRHLGLNVAKLQQANVFVFVFSTWLTHEIT